MRLYTVEKNGKTDIAIEKDGSLCIFEDMGYQFKDMNDFIDKHNDEMLAEINQKAENCEKTAFSAVKILAPIQYPKQDVLCLGVNYKEHADECEIVTDDTVYFSKRVNKASATGDIIPEYKGLVDSLDYEVELGVIIGKDAFNVTEETALDYVFGYTIVNDVSARNLQFKHKQWYRGKSLDGFTPIGPCIVTKDEIEDVQSLEIKSIVNNEVRQHSNTAKMIHSVAFAVSELSEGMTLQKGTIIATGTPSGVGLGMTPPTYLKKGDVVKCEIEKIGYIENTVE